MSMGQAYIDLVARDQTAGGISAAKSSLKSSLQNTYTNLLAKDSTAKGVASAKQTLARTIKQTYVDLLAKDKTLRGSLTARASLKTTLRNHYVDILARNKTGPGIAQAKSALDHISGLWSSIGIAVAGAAALGFGKMAVQEAMTAEAALSKLHAALGLMGQDTATNIASFEALAASLQKTTVHEDDALIATMAYGASLGVGAGNIEKFTRMAVGLQAIMGGTLNEAMLKISRISMGLPARLMGIPFKATGNAAVDMANLFKIAEGGMTIAENKAKTTEGRFTQLRVAVGNLAEAVGKTLLPGVMAITVALTGLINWLQGLPPWVYKAAIAVGVFAGVLILMNNLTKIAQIAQAAYGATLTYVQGLMGNWVAIAVSAAAAIGAFYALWAFGSNVMKEGEKAAQDLAAALQKITDAQNGFNTETAKANSAAGSTAAQVDPIRAKAEQLMNLVKQEGEAQKAEADRMRAAIGWSGIGEAWKKAQAAGAKFRFEAVGKLDQTTMAPGGFKQFGANLGVAGSQALTGGTTELNLTRILEKQLTEQRLQRQAIDQLYWFIRSDRKYQELYSGGVS